MAVLGRSYLLNGRAGSDTIWGVSGAQTIMGDGGDDLLMAGIGAETVIDLAAHVSAGTGGDPVVSLGGWSVTLAGVSASQVTSHLQQVFKVV